MDFSDFKLASQSTGTGKNFVNQNGLPHTFGASQFGNQIGCCPIAGSWRFRGNCRDGPAVHIGLHIITDLIAHVLLDMLANVFFDMVIHTR